MKHIYLLCFLLINFAAGFTQEGTQAGFQRYPTIPPFTLLKADSTTTLTRDNLEKRKRTMIMYFSPGCDHCRHQTDSMLANISKFKNVQIVMATYQPLHEMKSFYDEYELGKYTNITIGRDTRYFFQPFYRIKNLPFMALYNQQGRLITTFEGSTAIAKLVQSFR